MEAFGKYECKLHSFNFWLIYGVKTDFWFFNWKSGKMNHYFNHLIKYHEIQQQKRKGKEPSQIASFLDMNTRMVKKYLAMSEQKGLLASLVIR